MKRTRRVPRQFLAAGGDHRQHDRGRDRLIVGKLDQLALAAGLQEQALGRRQRAFRRSRDSSLSVGR